jgi:glyoxylase-like metal-dependent hydrolase (beta-lactamase superfamily II)
VWHPQEEQRGASEPVLFDCGFPWSGRALVAGLAALGCRTTDVRTIAITHDDFDHTGRLASLYAVSRAAVIAHEREAERLAARSWRALPGIRGPFDLGKRFGDLIAARWSSHRMHVTRPIQDGDELPGGWKAVHTPGHTPGHTSYFHSKLRVLIAGDALGSTRRGRVRPANTVFTEDAEAASRSVYKLAHLEPRVICFGHGPELYDAADALWALADSLISPSSRGNR